MNSLMLGATAATKELFALASNIVGHYWLSLANFAVKTPYRFVAVFDITILCGDLHFLAVNKPIVTEVVLYT